MTLIHKNQIKSFTKLSVKLVDFFPIILILTVFEMIRARILFKTLDAAIFKANLKKKLNSCQKTSYFG